MFEGFSCCKEFSKKNNSTVVFIPRPLPALKDEFVSGTVPLCFYSMCLQDMVCLAGLRPPLDHIHTGRDLRDLLERVKGWLGDVAGGCRKRDEKDKAACVVDVASSGYSDVLFDDFSTRRDGICRSLASLIAMEMS